MHNTITTTATPSVGGISLRLERLLWACWVPLVLFTIFFAPIPDVHDGMHPLRHSTTVVQCH